MTAAVLVTGPGNGRELADALTACGLQPVRLPLLQTRPVCLSPSLLAQAGELLARADAAVVTSPRAAKALIEAVQALRAKDACWTLTSGPLLTVGPSTAATLRQHRLPAAAPSAGEGSEALLDSIRHRLQPSVDGRLIAIVTGYAFRPFLAMQMRKQGARVAAVKLYRRLPACLSADQRRQLHTALTGRIPAIVTSATALHALCRQAAVTGDRLTLPPLLTISARLASVAASLGYPRTLNVGGTSPQKLAQAALALLDGRLKS